MSKKSISVPLLFAALLQILQLINNLAGQELNVSIEITADPPNAAKINGSFRSTHTRTNPKNLWFLNDYAGIGGIAERISDVRTTDDRGVLPTKRFAAAEYVADSDITGWQYVVDLKPFTRPETSAHLSWMGGGMGVLRLGDLLPQGGHNVGAYVTVSVPDGWSVYTESVPGSDRYFTVRDIDKVSFVVGRSWRRKEILKEKGQIDLLLSGDWQFSDDDARSIAGEIFGAYQKAFGELPNRAQVSIAKFPVTVPVDQWEADTRGTSILILSSDTPFRSQSIQRLHEQLRHEIFHLWIPEGVNLSGSYDWFYEGFALYQSLKLGLAVNRIRFDDYLDTLSRAYDIDKTSSPKISLIQASKDRWHGAKTQVYARGMLVAFLCDLALLDRYKGKTSVTDLLRELYLAHRPPAAPADGNETVLARLRSHKELVPIVDRYITGAESIDWQPMLSSAGLTANAENKLGVLPKPTGRQRDLLDKLGYNNWRKLPPTPRK